MLAIPNGSCLPADASSAWCTTFQSLLAQAVEHVAVSWRFAIIGREPVGAVTGEIDWEGTDIAGRPVRGDISLSMQQRFRADLTAALPSGKRGFWRLNECLGTSFASRAEIAIPAGSSPLTGARAPLCPESRSSNS